MIKTVPMVPMKMKCIVSMSTADQTSSNVEASSAFPVICSAQAAQSARMAATKKTAVSIFDCFPKNFSEVQMPSHTHHSTFTALLFFDIITTIGVQDKYKI